MHDFRITYNNETSLLNTILWAKIYFKVEKITEDKGQITFLHDCNYYSAAFRYSAY